MQLFKEEIINENVVKLTKDEKEIYLVGTAHVSKDSVKQIREIIEEVNPDTIAVELCESRYKSIIEKERWQNLDIIKVIKEGKGFLLFATFILSSFQKRIGLKLDSISGQDMIEGVNIAKEKGINIVLADRDINITLKRVWSLASFKEKMIILETIFESIFEKEKINESQIKELMEDGDLLSSLMTEFSKNLPFIKKTLIDERDLYIANKIINSEGKKIVCIIGKGHLSGIKTLLANRFNYDVSIETVPEKKNKVNIASYIVPLIFLIIIILGFIKGKTIALNMLKYWVVANGFFTSLFLIPILANPLTIVSAWVVSPITSLNPTIGAGIVLAIIEAFFKKPRVKDFENLSEDMTTFKGFIKNRITKILLVFIMGSIGSSIGTFVGLPFIVSLLK
ncbi:MAG: TraB/GumN family protein [Spirochaetes bacterium]|nr:TraB/GumN family protein [Spirochaetota bacterium]